VVWVAEDEEDVTEAGPGYSLRPLPSATMSLLARARAFLPAAAPRTPAQTQTRGRHQLAPKSTPYPKRHKGVIPVPTGGSTKGTTLAFGSWGIRIKGPGVRLSAKQLTTAEEVIKRKIKVIKGARVWLRVFPDIPVCIKGSETRMGKGKGTFEFWATRYVVISRVCPCMLTTAVAYPPVASSSRLAAPPFVRNSPVKVRSYSSTAPARSNTRTALRQAATKLPTKMEFINHTSPARLGNLLVEKKAAAPPPPAVETAEPVLSAPA
jgi:ribosomal protein L16